MTSTIVMHVGDVRDVLDGLIAKGETFDFLVTSPPFWKLRSYLPSEHAEKHREIGSEATPGEFLNTMFDLTAKFFALLPDWASVCVELGDTLAGSGGAGGDYDTNGLRDGQQRFNGSAAAARAHAQKKRTRNPGPDHPLAKSACGIPQGYYLGLIYGRNPMTGEPTELGQVRNRNWLTWARPNPPVGSLGKRNPHRRTGDQKFRPACSFITVACRGTGRYFDLDAVRTEFLHPDHNERNGRRGGPTYGLKGPNTDRGDLGAGNWHSTHAGAPPLDWHTDDLDGDWLWKLATAPYPGSHYATYPLTLPRRLIQAMCPARVCRVCGWPSERIVKGERLDPDAVRGNRKHDERANLPRGFSADPPGSGDLRGAYAHTTIGWTDCGCVDPDARHDPITDDLIDRYGNPATLGWTDCGCSPVCAACDGTGQEPESRWEDDSPTHPCRRCDSTGYKRRAPWRTGRTLDPFGGSGTTAVAAALEGRDAVLIDLDSRNLSLVDERIRKELRVLSVRAIAGSARTDEEGRCGRTPVKGGTIRPVATSFRWVVDVRLPKEKKPVVGQTNLLDLLEAAS